MKLCEKVLAIAKNEEENRLASYVEEFKEKTELLKERFIKSQYKNGNYINLEDEFIRRVMKWDSRPKYIWEKAEILRRAGFDVKYICDKYYVSIKYRKKKNALTSVYKAKTRRDLINRYKKTTLSIKLARRIFFLIKEGNYEICNRKTDISNYKIKLHLEMSDNERENCSWGNLRDVLRRFGFIDLNTTLKGDNIYEVIIDV